MPGQLNLQAKWWELDDPGEMLAALEELVSLGYKGSIEAWHDLVDGQPTGEPVWHITVSKDEQYVFNPAAQQSGNVTVGIPGLDPVTAKEGERFLLLAGVIQVVSPEEIEEMGQA